MTIAAPLDMVLFDPQPDEGIIAPDVLQRAYGCVPSGVVTICALVDEGDGPMPMGMVASSFVTVSNDPPLVAFCVQWSSSTWPRLSRAPRLGISLLSQEHADVAWQIASRSRDRFQGLRTSTTVQGAIFIEEATAWLECTVQSVVDAGDHGVVLMRVDAVTAAAERAPLVRHGSKFHGLAQLTESRAA